MLKCTIEGTKVKWVLIVLDFIENKTKQTKVVEDVLCLLQGIIGIYLGFMPLKNMVTELYNCSFWSSKEVINQEAGWAKLGEEYVGFIS